MNNRIYKFRAWDKKNKCWNYFMIPDDIHIIAEYYRNNELENTSQFTELLDKNGKKIYEGDIVEFILYENASSTFWEIKIPEIYITMNNEKDSSRIEVIGNIYENPELLK